MDRPENEQGAPPFDLDGCRDWLIEQGLLGLPLDEQFGGLCNHLRDAGLAIDRAAMGMAMLHPRYGAQTYTWRAKDGTDGATGRAGVEIIYIPGNHDANFREFCGNDFGQLPCRANRRIDACRNHGSRDSGRMSFLTVAPQYAS